MRKIVPVLITILVLSVNTYADEYNNLINEGITLFQKYEYDKALTLFNKAKNLNPSLPIAYFATGMVFYSKRDTVKGGIEFKNAVLFSRSEEEKKATIKNIYQATSKTINDEEKTLFNEAYNLIEDKKPEEAINKLTRALEINPYNARLYYEIGYAYIDVNNLFLAMIMLEKGREINPVYEPTLKELLYCYIKLNIDYKVKEIANDLELLGEDKLYLYREVGYYYYRTKQNELAIYALERFAKLSPTTYFVYFLIGNSYFNINEKEKAKQNLILFLNNINKIPDSTTLNKSELRKTAEEIIRKCD